VAEKIEIKLNWFDRTVGFFSPTALIKRRKARTYDKWLSTRKYEGADAGRRTDGWNTNNQSANAEIATALPRVRDRARDLVRNNPYAARAVQVITNNVVGKGIPTEIKVDTRSEKSTREKKLNNIWKTWAETTACDFEGVHTLAGLQRLAMRAVVESGEVLIRRRRVGRRTVTGANGKPTEIPPIQLQVLESDFLSVDRRSGILPNGNQVIQGVEIDRQGKKVAYHLFMSHPGSNDLVFASRFTTIRVPANEILHLYRMDRPGQIRGMSWLANIILRLRDFDLYEDAQLKQQQCTAMFTAFVHDLEGLSEDEEVQQEVEFGEKMEPGRIDMLPPGKTITLAKPPSVSNYGEYTSVILHSIAAGLGITYESMTGNLAKVNFSSGRMGWLEMHRNVVTWANNIMIAQMMRPTFTWFTNAIELMGESTKDMRAVHTPPRREMIDPVKETQALKTAVRSGFKTQSQALRELGFDPDTFYEEKMADDKTLDDNEIVLDTDPRKVNNVGNANSDHNDDDDDDDDDDDKNDSTPQKS